MPAATHVARQRAPTSVAPLAGSMACTGRAHHRHPWRSSRRGWHSSDAATRSPIATVKAAVAASPALLGTARFAAQAGHSEQRRTELLISLAKPMDPARRAAALDEFLSGITVWESDDWDPAWRRAVTKPAVAQAIAQGAGLAATDFVAGVHVPREAGEQLPGLPWPERRTDFLAFPMLGFCHATAAVAFALATAVFPAEKWFVLVSTAHATVLSLTSGLLVDFASTALGERLVPHPSEGALNAVPRGEVAAKDLDPGYVAACGIDSLKQMVLATTEWAAYPSLEIYLQGIRASSPLARPMPAWAPPPRGCDSARFKRLVASGAMDEAFARGQAMWSVNF